jgi:hypothetical protein
MKLIKTISCYFPINSNNKTCLYTFVDQDFGSAG